MIGDMPSEGEILTGEYGKLVIVGCSGEEERESADVMQSLAALACKGRERSSTEGKAFS